MKPSEIKVAPALENNKWQLFEQKINETLQFLLAFLKSQYSENVPAIKHKITLQIVPETLNS